MVLVVRKALCRLICLNRLVTLCVSGRWKMEDIKK